MRMANYLELARIVPGDPVPEERLALIAAGPQQDAHVPGADVGHGAAIGERDRSGGPDEIA